MAESRSRPKITWSCTALTEAFFQRISEENLAKAISYYEQAVKLDPGYARAWAGLAEARGFQSGTYGNPLDCERARKEAERALTLDPNQAEALAALAAIQMDNDFDWTGAEASLQKALALEPNNADVVRHAAELAATLGRTEQARAFNRRAVELNPLDPFSYVQLATIGRGDEAVAAIRKSLELDPQQPWSHFMLGSIYLRQARPQQALEEMERETHPGFRLHGLTLAYHALGRKPESDAALAELIAKGQRTAAFQIAEVYAFRGETDQAFRWLEKAYAQRDSGLRLLKGDWLLKSLEGDPRYATFLKKMRLPT